MQQLAKLRFRSALHTMICGRIQSWVKFELMTYLGRRLYDNSENECLRIASRELGIDAQSDVVTFASTDFVSYLLLSLTIRGSLTQILPAYSGKRIIW